MSNHQAEDRHWSHENNQQIHVFLYSGLQGVLFWKMTTSICASFLRMTQWQLNLMSKRVHKPTLDKRSKEELLWSLSKTGPRCKNIKDRKQSSSGLKVSGKGRQSPNKNFENSSGSPKNFWSKPLQFIRKSVSLVPKYKEMRGWLKTFAQRCRCQTKQEDGCYTHPSSHKQNREC